jgi:predicted metalloprotease with PDZ domain
MTRSDDREQWEQNNESFHYDPPEQGPEYWSKEEFTELYDRVIRRRVTWECQECSEPMRSLEHARRHVSNKHGEKLIDQAKRKIDVNERDPRPSGQDSSDTEKEADQPDLGDW